MSPLSYFSLSSLACSLFASLAFQSYPVHGLPLDSITELDTRDTSSSVVRGVNIGGWLLLEPYLNYDIMGTAQDQWTFDATVGAASTLQSHWASYFTEADVAQIAAWGLNTIRIPVGFWAYNNTGTPYISGADAYLEKALGWCRTHGIKALICAHGLPGSQNGYDNSGHQGTAAWINDYDFGLSLSVLETIVNKYGTLAWSDVVWGLELVNEPIIRDTSSFNQVINWVNSTFNALYGIAENQNLKIIMQDAYLGASTWEQVGATINSECNEPTFYLDLHLYQNEDSADSQLNQSQHIQKVCDYKTTTFLPDSTTMPIIVGEFSDQTNICVDSKGVATAGTSCSTTGCQCSANTDTSNWNQYLINATRMYLETEIEVFENYSDGWFLWSYSGPGAWGLKNLFQYGVIGPDTVTQRKFPYQCSS